MVDDEALLRTFEDYATGLVSPFDVDDVLHHLVERVVAVVGVAGAGVSLARDDQHLGFVAATDGAVAEVEEHQDVRGGPCHEAFLTNDPVVVDDLAADERWPAYRRAAEELGFRSVVAVPLPTNDDPLGAMNVYDRSPRDWGTRDVEVAGTLAAMASGYLLTSVALNERRTLEGQVASALASRTVVEQARGIVSGHWEVDTNLAFATLHTHARRTASTLHAVARRIVAGDLDPPEPTPDPSIRPTSHEAPRKS